MTSSTFDRETVERQMRQEMDERHVKAAGEAKAYFNKKTGLEEAIQTKILPALVSLSTKNGIAGVGFFQHSEWLVSNAHIISCKEVLDAGVEVVNHESNSIALTIEESYHRPMNRDGAPDVVVVKVSGQKSSQCLPTQFSDDEDSGQRYIFYIDLNANRIKFLDLCSDLGSYPLVYKCRDGFIPEPGCSGTPIVEARVMLGRSPTWQFKVIGALYARCSSEEYVSSRHLLGVTIADSTKLVCAIPIKQEFSQILNILHARVSADRVGKMADAAFHLGDAQGKRDAERYKAMEADSKKTEEVELRKFGEGDSELNISLPEGLEKLWYKKIVGIADSLMIKEVLDRQLKKRAKELYNTISAVSLADLMADFKAFIQQIKAEANIELKSEDNFKTSANGYFRIDVRGSVKSGWTLDIQDNTGKHRVNKQPLSSKFAIVTIPKGNTSVKASDLAKLFDKSQRDLAPKDPSSLSPIVTSTVHTGPSDRKTERSYRNKQAYLATMAEEEKVDAHVGVPPSSTATVLSSLPLAPPVAPASSVSGMASAHTVPKSNSVDGKSETLPAFDPNPVNLHVLKPPGF